MKLEEIQIGTPVTYWGVIKQTGEKFDPVETTIESEPWALGHGDMVCRVKGIDGGVLITHLDKLVMKEEWWGYKSTSGTIHAKRFFDQGDVSAARSSDFVDMVVPPFKAANREDALEYIKAYTI